MIMKTLLKSLFIFLFSASIVPSNAQCKAKPMVKQFKADLAPFQYDSYVINDVLFKKEKQIVEVEFTAYAGLEYKMVFCTSFTNATIGITIFDKPKTNKKRKPIFFTESGKDGYLCAFKPAKTGTFYIEYEIPVANEKVTDGTKGCVLMLIGIKEN